MADFAAVIRRAVDGLSDNTPEMRVKVYEKARGAVQRQLESMKPRPPEEMLRRQLDKLELAISEVEDEHAEAMPALDDDEPVYEQESWDEPEAIDGRDAETERRDEPEEAHAAEPLTSQPVEAYGPTPGEDEPRAVAMDEPQAAVMDEHERDPWEPAAEADRHVPAEEQSSTGIVPDERQIGLWQEPLAEEPAQEPLADEPVPPPSWQVAHQAVVSRDVVASDEAWQDEPEPVAERRHADPFAGEPAPSAIAQPVYLDAGPDERTEDDDGVAAESSHVTEPAAETRPTVEMREDDWLHETATADQQDGHQPVDASPAVEPAPADDGATGAARFDRHDDPVWSPEPREEERAAEPLASPGAEALAEQPTRTLNIREEKAPGAFDDLMQGGAADEARDDPFVAEPKMPAALDLLAWDEPAATDGHARDKGRADAHPANPFEDDDGVFSGDIAPVAAGATVASRAGAQDSWSDLDDLIGDDKAGHGGRGASQQRLGQAADLGQPTRQTKSFRAEPKRRVNLAAIILALFVVAALGGGGYAAWLYKDKLNELAQNLMNAGPQIPGIETTPAENADTTPTTGETPATTTETTTAQTPATTPTASDTSKDLASLDSGNVSINKFTQRLRNDGSEVDDGPALPIGGEPLTAEGKTVAEQNIAASDTPPISGTATQPTTATDETPLATPTTDGTATDPATTTPTAGTTTTDPAATAETPTTTTTTTDQQTTQPAATPVGAQKMFLYEERLGQSVPTAIEGSVIWTLQEEAGENGKTEPAVQGQINVPDRGLSALITFKRNSDPSLPASHLVEIVFSLPSGFEGGAIDSVQRIAMKQTEQDRGNALIAVPAKITDDFHMIALNDFPDARATNLELMRTRDWIDMPITYRNGRRALLTLEKGATGRDAFTKAIQTWSTLGDPTTGQ